MVCVLFEFCAFLFIMWVLLLYVVCWLFKEETNIDMEFQVIFTHILTSVEMLNNCTNFSDGLWFFAHYRFVRYYDWVDIATGRQNPTHQLNCSNDSFGQILFKIVHTTMINSFYFDRIAFFLLVPLKRHIRISCRFYLLLSLVLFLFVHVLLSLSPKSLCVCFFIPFANRLNQYERNRMNQHIK